MQATNDKHNMILDPCVVVQDLATTAGIAGIVHMMQPMTLRLTTKVAQPNVELTACFEQMVRFGDCVGCLDDDADCIQRSEPQFGQ